MTANRRPTRSSAPKSRPRATSSSSARSCTPSTRTPPCLIRRRASPRDPARPFFQQVEIQGHADERGSDEHNLQLTDDRAHSVQKYLVDKGVDAGRLIAKGYGETKPIDPRHNEAAWAKNRRVEFVILQRK